MYLAPTCGLQIECHCVDLDKGKGNGKVKGRGKGKGKGFPNKLLRPRQGMGCLAFTLIFTFGTIVMADFSAVRACSSLPPGKLFSNVFRWRLDALQGY